MQEQQEAVVAALNQARGFGAFIEHEQLISALPWFSAEGATGKALGQKIARELQERDELIAITMCALQGFRHMDGDVGVLATRIFDQLNEDLTTKPEFRKPALYVAGVESGFGVAVTIDDRFWTDEWLEAGP